MSLLLLMLRHIGLLMKKLVNWSLSWRKSLRSKTKRRKTSQDPKERRKKPSAQPRTVNDLQSRQVLRKFIYLNPPSKNVLRRKYAIKQKKKHKRKKTKSRKRKKKNIANQKPFMTRTTIWTLELEVNRVGNSRLLMLLFLSKHLVLSKANRATESGYKCHEGRNEKPMPIHGARGLQARSHVVHTAIKAVVVVVVVAARAPAITIVVETVSVKAKVL
mmetsp:Transcript_20578/g.36603  ORF Transcript_20578/g.36603 Transcript_20578/m.36603 type:complete len:217 (-) Transcript_20578:215-865(-)